jgi:hypothetical protein
MDSIVIYHPLSLPAAHFVFISNPVYSLSLAIIYFGILCDIKVGRCSIFLNLKKRAYKSKIQRNDYFIQCPLLRKQRICDLRWSKITDSYGLLNSSIGNLMMHLTHASTLSFTCKFLSYATSDLSLRLRRD